ncbi:dTDP-4-dehydrorhamnose reductase [uncultured Cocleimonas sp.]|uniref:dTDP-4-dehydrorhamnose reductase n=1 Tax=uncultured Cocleimonas sp. TaxID=1051587 RepID=UPI002632A7B9|nr:dTDP-4-dehydrorhamnose reductase [uncultured Cocleimonas sp.]
MKKVLITGADGQLGFELQRSLPDGFECLATDKDALDITDAQAVNAYIQQQKPDVIINSAAYTAVDKAEEETDLAIAINTTGAKNLAQAAKDNHIKLVQISTDFVFDGKACSPYKVDAVTDPDGYYGKTKRDGDNLVAEILGDDALIIRTSWLYSSHGSNFVKTMLRFMQEREELGIIADQIGTPTWANSLANAVWKAIELDTTGFHHWSDAGVASWYDFAYAIMEEGVSLGLLDKEITINPITTADYPTPASRPCYSVLDKTVTWKELRLKSDHWRVALRNMMKELKAN